MADIGQKRRFCLAGWNRRIARITDRDILHFHLIKCQAQIIFGLLGMIF